MENKDKPSMALLNEITKLQKELEQARENCQNLLREQAQYQELEKALQDSRQQLRNIIDFLPDATFVVDKQGKVFSWNRAMEDLTRVKAEDIIGKDNYAYSLPFYGERRPVLIDLILNPEISLSGRYDCLNKKDETLTAEAFCPHIGESGIFVRISASPLYDYSGSKAGAIESFRDISDFRQTLEALRDSEARFRGLAESSPALIFVLQNNRLRYVNPRFSALTEYDEEEYLDMDFGDFIHPYFRNSVKSKALAWQGGENQYEKYEMKLLTRSGKEIWVEIYANPIQYEGQPALIGSLFDISERKHFEEALRQSEVLYRTIFETTGTAMMIFDKDLMISLVNSEFEELSGYSKEEIEKKMKWPVFVHPDDRERMIGYHQQRRIDPELGPSHYEFKLLDK
ncbi:MAG: PAS domain S-box protein, partial [Syntrophomonas sp.]|nr:PAS domain S-box protein [Syntrophomonas sp.]